MSPARRRRRKKRKNKKKKRSIRRVVFWLLLIVAVLLFVHFTTKYWAGDRKLSIVVAQEGGDIQVSTFDPEAESIYTVSIPASTEVRVARQLGTWRLESVWRLGEKEGIDGKLLSETITRQFKMPVYVWAEGPARGFSTGSPTSLLKAAVYPYSTNMGVGDRIRLAIFSFGIKNFKKQDIDLAKTKVLEKAQLVDGSLGYKVVGEVPARVAAIYSDPALSLIGAKTQIVDATATNSVAEDVGEIVEVLGLKTASIEEVDPKDMDCLVSGKDRATVAKFSELLSCGVVEHEKENFDLSLTLGKEFARRY